MDHVLESHYQATAERCRLEKLVLAASKGGHLHRTYDRPPGSEVVWRGYVRLGQARPEAGRGKRSLQAGAV